MVMWLFRLCGCFLLGSTEHKVRFTLVSGAVGAGMSVSSAGGASASHGESGFWKNRADPNTARRVKLVFPNGTVQGYYKSEQEANESLAFFKKNSMFGKDCMVVVESSMGSPAMSTLRASSSNVRSYARMYKGEVIGHMPAADLGKPNKNGRSLSADLFGVQEVPVNASFGEVLPSGQIVPLGNNRPMVPVGRQMLPSGRSRLVYPNVDLDQVVSKLAEGLGVSEQQMSAVLGVATLGARSMFSDLRSGAGRSIVSAKGSGVTNGGVLTNISYAQNVVKLFKEYAATVGRSVQWDISSAVGRVSGGVVSLESVCKVNGRSVPVVFWEDSTNKLTVRVRGVDVVDMEDGARSLLDLKENTC